MVEYTENQDTPISPGIASTATSAAAPSAQQTAPAQSSATQEVDVSRSTIIVLVMLTLIISVLGTWTVLHETNPVKVVSRNALPVGGEVRLNILPPGTDPNQGPISSTTGQVSLIINKQNNQ